MSARRIGLARLGPRLGGARAVGRDANDLHLRYWVECHGATGGDGRRPGRAEEARDVCDIPDRFETAALGRPRGHLAVAPCQRADAPCHWDLSDPWRRGTA